MRNQSTLQNAFVLHDRPLTPDAANPSEIAEIDALLALVRLTFEVPAAEIALDGKPRATASQPPSMRFEASAPLTLPDGRAIGSLTLRDTRARRLTREQTQTLADLASMAAGMLRRAQDTETMARLLRDREVALAHSHKIFERASVAAKIGVWECDLAFESLRWSDVVYDIFELPRGSPIDRAQILDFYAPESRNRLDVLRRKAIEECGGFTLDAKIKTCNGQERWIRITLTVEAANGVAVRIFGMKQDITEEKALGERTRYLAEFDSLTGLANRASFQSTLNRPRPSDGGDPRCALMLIDLDGFKPINDTFGHAHGDECLKQIARRLRDSGRSAELVARIGGDEFAILLGSDFDRQAIEALAEAILHRLRDPIAWQGQSFQLGASIGVAIPDGTRPYTPSELFIEADLALYAAKAAGRSTFRVFTADMKRKAERRSEIVEAIGQGITAEELDLFYKPKLCLLTKRLSGFEALFRWRRPDGSIASADEFQDAFEDPGLSARLGQWAVDKVVRQASAWAEEGRDFGHIAVNLSAPQIRDPRFAADLIERISDFGLRPDMIEIEVAESLFLSEAAHIGATLARLRSGGIRVALDDFGRGLGSLTQLRTYPIDSVKLGRSLVGHCLASVHDRAVIEATIGLCSRLAIDIVAEGIETIEQLECLKAMGCRTGQGLHFGAPLPASQAAAWHRPKMPKEAAAINRPEEKRAQR